MRYYELTINTKQADALLEKVAFYLPGHIVHRQKNPSFLTLEFYSHPEKISEIEKKLKADSLRYLILTKKPSTIFRRKRAAVIQKKPIIVRKKVVKEKVELAEIEKKIEEILGE